jgi:hemolysin activation/secretion protein
VIGLMIAMLLASAGQSAAADGVAPAAAPPAAPARAVPPRTLDVAEYRIEGSTVLPQAEVEAALYPFLGPGRTLEDVERARAALEKAYSDRGYQSVAVAIPRQTVRDGVVALEVTEGKIGRLRVRGARWFSPFDIKRQATSVAEGTVPNFNEVVRDIYLLNQVPDRRVTPVIRAGAVPGTVDVDLNVEDALPLHGSLEMSNRSSPSTTPLRLGGSLHYDNLWQLGHSLAFNFQVAPQRVLDGKVFTASYLARLPDVPWLTLSANGALQDSDVSTLGAMAVQGRGRILGARAMFALPGSSGVFQSIGTGVDYKHLEQYDWVQLTPTDGSPAPAPEKRATPITYWPLSTQYAATWAGERSQTQLGASVVLNVRGLGSDAQRFDDKRYGASGSFIYYRAELSRTDELATGIQLAGRAQGQLSGAPLLPSEQLTAGGADSVRGYLEVQAAGDFGGVGSVEVRSPSLARWSGRRAADEWRFHAFADAGWVGIHAPLPEQQRRALLWSAGAGSRAKVVGHVSGSVDLAVPLAPEGTTRRFHPRVHFRVSSEF